MSYLREFPNATMQDFLYFNGMECFDHILKAFADLMKGPSRLTHMDREMLGAYCNALQQVPQPMNVHIRCFALLGGEAWKIHDLVKDPLHRCVEEKFRPLLHIVRKLTLEGSNSVCKAEIDACYDAGWDGDTIFRVTVLTGMYNMMLRWVSATGVKYTPEEIIASSDGLTRNGYAGEGPGLNDADYKARVAPLYRGVQGSEAASARPRGLD